ncbi:MAG: hypothetical protein IJ489_02815 [Clostridia bacterium]|nr:hypothetical protein [Clostridia bacterium]
MSVFAKKCSPEEKKAREKEYLQWKKDHSNPTLMKIINIYAKIASVLFFATVLLEYYINLGAFYAIFPIAFLLHLLIVFTFPACFSLLPSYGKPRTDNEAFPAGLFLMIPSIFPIFYLLRGASWKLWLASAVFALILFGLLLLRYQKEVRAYVSFSVFYEYFILMMAVFGMLVMTNSLVAQNHLVDTTPVIVTEKTQNDSAYTLTVCDENGETLTYNVTEAFFQNTESGDTLSIETYEGLFEIRFTKLTE